MNRIHVATVASIVVAACMNAAVAAERHPVAPLTLYQSETPQDIQFYDRDGRALFFGGAYTNARLVTSPVDAVSANVRLTPAEFGKDGCPIDDPAFWCETSKVALNTGDHLRVKPCGYAVSIFVPATCDYRAANDEHRARKDASGASREYWDCMQRIWYDRDFREIACCSSQHLGCEVMPANSVYVRFLIPWSKYDCYRDQRLVRVCPRNWADPRPVEPHPGEIVLGHRSDCREQYAAAELVREVRTITGKTLPVVASPTKGAPFRVWIGRDAAERGRVLDADVAKKLRGSDGYAIRRRGKDIYVFGLMPRGTIFGTMKLLELVSDFCWWRPDRDSGLGFTPRSVLDFASVGDCEDRPVFSHRTYFVGSCPCLYAFDDWALHHGITREQLVGRHFTVWNYHAKRRGFVTTVGASFLKLALEGNEDRSDWWPMINNRRDVGAIDGQPCYSNPEVVKATIANVNRILDDAPEEWDSFSFRYSDSWLCCECPRCCEPIPLPAGGQLECHSMLADKDPVFRSTRTYMVANEIAKAVTARFPGKPVTMLAYIYTAAPPAVKLHPAIRVLYATYGGIVNMRFPSKELTDPTYGWNWADRTAVWCAREPKAMGLYEYYFSSAPGLYAEVAAENLRQMADAGAYYRVHTESSLDGDSSGDSLGSKGFLWDVNAIEQVLLAQLFWNPYRDVADLRSRLLDRVYGPEAAGEMKELYRLFAKCWFDKSIKTAVNCHTPPADVYYEFIVKPGIEKQVRACLESASRKTKSPSAKLQLARMAKAFQKMRAGMDRREIPCVPELAQEWQVASSPQWNKAFTLKDFRDALPDPSDPQQMTCDLSMTPPSLSATKTRVDFACDAKYLYWRVTPETKGGYVSLDFLVGKYNDRHSFFASGERVETGRIPFGAILKDATDPIFAVACRYDAKGSCSFGRSAENATRSFPGSRRASCSRFFPEAKPLIDENDAKLGLGAAPPMTFPDAELENHPLAKTFAPLRGMCMRRVRGVPVLDTGFGNGTGRIPAKPGDRFIVTGDRWRYAQYTRIAVGFYDEKGNLIRSTPCPNDVAMKDGLFRFGFSCPDDTASFTVYFYDSYLKSFDIIRE